MRPFEDSTEVVDCPPEDGLQSIPSGALTALSAPSHKPKATSRGSRKGTRFRRKLPGTTLARRSYATRLLARDAFRLAAICAVRGVKPCAFLRSALLQAINEAEANPNPC